MKKYFYEFYICRKRSTSEFYIYSGGNNFVVFWFDLLPPQILVIFIVRFDGDQNKVPGFEN